MSVPNDRRYLQTHEWHQPQGDLVVIGITQKAADELTDITFVQLPKVGTKIVANKAFGEIESVKATSDLYSGVAGEVVAVNETLNAKPGVINEDPFAAGWMIKIKPTNASEVNSLLSAEDYQKATGH